MTWYGSTSCDVTKYILAQSDLGFRIQTIVLGMVLYMHMRKFLSMHTKVYLPLNTVWRSFMLPKNVLFQVLLLVLYLKNFVFQESFRPRFLSVAELLHKQGFKVGGSPWLKQESFQNL